MEPIPIEFESTTLKFVLDDDGKSIAVVCSNVIYIGIFVAKGSDAFISLSKPRVLPIDALMNLEERASEAKELPVRDIEINLFQVQALFNFEP